MPQGEPVIGVSTKWGDWFRPDEAADVPSDLIGATIIAIGAPIAKERFEGGGLVIDYLTKANEKKRILLEFNECGMWPIAFS